MIVPSMMGDSPESAARYLLRHIDRDRAILYVQRILEGNPHRGREFWTTVKKILVKDDLECKKCGCTCNNACKGGCYWISTDPPICSRCA